MITVDIRNADQKMVNIVKNRLKNAMGKKKIVTVIGKEGIAKEHLDLNILEIRNLSKDYDGFREVKEISFALEKGEVFEFL